MKILAINGSPRKNGNTSALAAVICGAAATKGHECETVWLYEKKIAGCVCCEECKKGTVKFCSQKDDMQEIYEKIVAADLLVFSSPVYFGQVTGPFKCFMDRWCTFFDDNFKTRIVNNKMFVSIVTSHAPEDKFVHVTQYLSDWFGGFFGMRCAGAIHGGGLESSDAALGREDLVKMAKEIAEKMNAK